MKLGPILALAVWASATSLLTAQNFAGDLLIGSASPASIQRIRTTTPASGQIVFQSPATASLIYGVTMDIDNQSVVFTQTLDPNQPATTGGVWKLDPATQTVLGTIALGAALFESPRQILVDRDGNYVVSSRGATSPTTFEYRLLRINRSTGVVTTIVRETAIGQPAEWRGGLIIDVNTGHYALLDRDPLAPIATKNPLMLITDAGAIATLTYVPVQPRYGLAQDIRTGDFYAGFVLDNLLDSGLLRIERNGTVTTPVFGSPGGSRHAFTSVVADRNTAAAPRLVSSYVDHIYHTDIATAAVTSIVAPPLTLRSPRSSVIEGSRHVQTLLRANRKWDILLSYPGLGGKAYAMAVGLSGVRPGNPLPDGRRILLNLDPIVQPSLLGLLRPIFSPGPGFLDATGRARGSLDVSSTAPLGLPIWIQVLVIDPAAPLGLAIIEDPYVIRI